MLRLHLILGFLAICQSENLFTIPMRQAFYNDVNITAGGENWIFESHGVPEHDSGPFPSRANPNTIQYQEHMYRIPRSPILEATPGCLNMGVIGIAINGVPFFNPYSSEGYNAVEGDNRERFDDCDGHPAQRGNYHYHKLPNCLYKANVNEQLLGIALDGYPIYNNKAQDGSTLTSKDLDLCHGHFVYGIYRYVITTDFPYIMGCYKGKTVQRRRPVDGDRPPPIDGDSTPPPDGSRPPPPDGGRPRPRQKRMDTCGVPCYANVSQPVACNDEDIDDTDRTLPLNGGEDRPPPTDSDDLRPPPTDGNGRPPPTEANDSTPPAVSGASTPPGDTNSRPPPTDGPIDSQQQRNGARPFVMNLSGIMLSITTVCLLL